METLEEAIRRLIKSTYGSVSKFSEVIDVPVTEDAARAARVANGLIEGAPRLRLVD